MKKLNLLNAYFAPILEEVFIECWFAGVLVFEHLAVKRGDLLSVDRKLHGTSVIKEAHIRRQRLIQRRKKRPVVFEERPLARVVVVLLLLPPAPHLLTLFFLFYALLLLRRCGGRR